MNSVVITLGTFVNKNAFRALQNNYALISRIILSNIIILSLALAGGIDIINLWLSVIS